MVSRDLTAASMCSMCSEPQGHKDQWNLLPTRGASFFRVGGRHARSSSQRQSSSAVRGHVTPAARSTDSGADCWVWILALSRTSSVTLRSYLSSLCLRVPIHEMQTSRSWGLNKLIQRKFLEQRLAGSKNYGSVCYCYSADKRRSETSFKRVFLERRFEKDAVRSQWMGDKAQHKEPWKGQTTCALREQGVWQGDVNTAGWSAGRAGADATPRWERAAGLVCPKGVNGDFQATMKDQICLSKGHFQKRGEWTGRVQDYRWGDSGSSLSRQRGKEHLHKGNVSATEEAWVLTVEEWDATALSASFGKEDLYTPALLSRHNGAVPRRGI